MTTTSTDRRQTTRRTTPGLLVRRAIDFALDCIDAIPFMRPRARYRLWFTQRVRTCGICRQREILIDFYCQYLAHRLRHWFARKRAALWQ